MSTTSITSALSSSTYTTSLSQQLAESKNEITSTLIKSLNNDDSTSSLLESVYSSQADLCSISAISESLNSISEAATASGITDGVDTVKAFAESLVNNGYDSLSILQYLSIARDLAKNDPDKFVEIFGSDDDSSEDTDTTEETEDIDDTTDTTSDTTETT
jgi:hypothetical protein